MPNLGVNITGNERDLLRAFKSSERGARQFNRELGRATRGALAGSGVFRGLGRNIAFASGGFLAFAGVGDFLRKSVDAAKEAGVVQRQLGVQLRNNGKDLADWRGQIDQTNLRLSALAGFTKDELDQSLTTILRTVGDVSQALRDNALAADLARARHIGLGQAALVIAKTEAGNTTLLRRQGFQIAKNATAEEALAKVRRVVAGQARAGATEQQRFGAILHDTEIIIGEGILPTLNKYLATGGKWLAQMNESGELQADVAKAAKAVSHAFGDAAAAARDVVKVVKVVDKVTGGFKHTLELLLLLKVGSVLRGFAAGFGGVGAAAGEKGAAGEVGLLSTRLSALNAITVAPIGIDIVYRISTKFLNATGGTGFFKGQGGKAFDALQQLGLFGGVKRPMTEAQIRAAVRKLAGPPGLHGPVGAGLTEADFAPAGPQGPLSTSLAAGGDRKRLTARQRNTFFDNALTRRLGRVQDVRTLRGQVSTLTEIAGLIKQRLAATKDVTRRMKLEDDLVDIFRQRAGIRGQIAANQKAAAVAADESILARLGFGVDKATATKGFADDITALNVLAGALGKQIAKGGDVLALEQQLFAVTQQIAGVRQQQTEAAQARRRNAAAALAKATARGQAQATAKQFAALGLGPTGGDRIPTAAQLRKQLGTVEKAFKGTVLDTAANRKTLQGVRKDLSGELGKLNADVRAKIKDLLDALTPDKAALDGTLFHKTSPNALLEGLGLSAKEKRSLRGRLAGVGVGGTVHGSGGGAFGVPDTQIVVPVSIDGWQIAKVVTKRQQTRTRRNPPQKRGPNAGR